MYDRQEKEMHEVPRNFKEPNGLRLMCKDCEDEHKKYWILSCRTNSGSHFVDTEFHQV